jgi:sortase A
MIRAQTLARRAGTLAIVVGIAMLSYVAGVLLEARAHRNSFHGASSSANAAGVTPAAPARLVEGEAIGEVRIDRIGMRAVISQGESDDVLRIGAGHLADTPWPGQAGNVVIAGHRDTIFRPLRNVREGDLVDLTTETTIAHYKVVSARVVDPTDLSVLKPGDGNTLTLITCYPFGFIGRAPERFVVRATELR